MKVRVLSNRWYPGHFLAGNVYEARPADDGENYMVFGELKQWLCMLPRELQFICPGVAVPSDER